MKLYLIVLITDNEEFEIKHFTNKNYRNLEYNKLIKRLKVAERYGFNKYYYINPNTRIIKKELKI